jgi:hypothetical protein
MSRLPARRRPKASPPKPNVALFLEQLESRDYPNDLFALLGSALVSGGLSVLGNAGATPRLRDFRDAEETIPFSSPSPRLVDAAPPVLPFPAASPWDYEPRPANDAPVQAAFAFAVSQSTSATDAVTDGLGDPLRFEAPAGGPGSHGLHLPDAPPTGNGSFGIASTVGGTPGTPAATPATTPSDFGTPRATSATAALNQSISSGTQRANLLSTAGTLTHPNLGQFGLFGHTHLGGHATQITSTSGLAPATLLSTALQGSNHGQRPSNLLSQFTTKGVGAFQPSGLGRTTATDATGVAGSLSPAVFLQSATGHDPAAIASQLATFHPAVGGTGSFASDRSLAGSMFMLGTGQTNAAAANSPAAIAAGAPLRSPPPLSGGTTCSNSSSSSDPLHGTFPFTLNVSGSDGQGAYAIQATGTVTIDIGPNANNVDVTTGSVQITSHFHRGPGGVSSSDPSTTQTQSFDPNGSGLLLGFDIDGYTTGLYAIALSTATSYSLTVRGGDSYTTAFSTTSNSSNSTTGETDNETTQGSDGGSDTLTLTVTGSGTARSYTFDDTLNDGYTVTDDATDQVQNATTSDSDVLHATDTGSETITGHEQGTVGASGQLTPATFTLTDTATDDTSDTDTINDQSSGSDQLSDKSTETDTDHATQTISLSGTPASWSGTVTDKDDGSLTLTDKGEDITSSTATGSTTTNDDNWNATDAGPVHSKLTVGVSGDASSQVNLQNLDVTVTGTITENPTTDTDTITTTGANPADETVTTTHNAQDAVTVHLTSPDGTSGTVTDSETITDSPTTIDTGHDAWNAPYTDPTSGQTLGTDSGSDQYTTSDSGASVTDVVNSSAPFDATGTLGTVTFTADVNGSDTVTGSDSGTDTVALTGETDVDRFNDNENGAGDTYGVHITNSSGPTTATVNATITDPQTSGDNQTDTWTGSSDSGTEHDNRTDNNTVTVGITNGVSTLDASGNSTPVSGQVTIGGTDTFGDTDHIVDDNHATGLGEQVDQTDRTPGTDQYTIPVTQIAGGTTFNDQENVNETLNDSGTLQQDGGGTADTGSMSLTGPVQAYLQQAGSAPGGQPTLGPTNGNDQVNLTGRFNNTTHVPSAPGTMSIVSSAAGIGRSDVGYSQYTQAALENVQTVFTDTGWQEQESDTEAAGAWAATAIQFNDTPTVTITDTANYAPALLSQVTDTSQFDPAFQYISGWQTDVITESLKEGVNGSGQSLTGNEQTYHDEEIDNNIQVVNPPAGTFLEDPGLTSEQTIFHSDSSKTDVLAGTDTASGDDHLTDTTTTHNDASLQDSYLSVAAPNSSRQYIAASPLFTKDDLTSVERRDGTTNILVSATGGGSTGGDEGSRFIQVNPPGTLTIRTLQGPSTAWTYDMPNGIVTKEYGPTPNALYRVTGIDPVSGAYVDTTTPNPGSVLSPAPLPPRDWFQSVSDFSAGMGDTISCGLTRQFRRGFGYDDVVDYNSRAYGVGVVAGEVVNIGLTVAAPCRAALWVRVAARGLNAVQAGHNAVNAAQAFYQGNIPGGLLYLAAAAGNMTALFGRACFTAGTPLLTPDGHKLIEDFKPGDWVLSAPEDNPEAPPEAKRVEEVFTNVAALLELRVGDRMIRTTAEHPFFVIGRGWTAARELMAGDRLRSHNERSVVLDKVVPLAEEVPVYNLRVADYHTYFVGGESWGFSVWAHNSNLCTVRAGLGGGPESAAVNLSNAIRSGVTRTPRHHIFPQQFRQWFLNRGINIDRFTIAIGQGEHAAIHRWVGGAGWNQALIGRLTDQMSARQIWTETYRLLREVGIRRPTFLPF